MNNKSKSIEDKFKIIISVGDESGIGPEIILKALFSKDIPHNLDFIIVGSKNNLENTYKNLKSLGVKNIVDPNNYQIHDIKIPFEINKPKKSNGNASFFYLKKAIEIVKKYTNAALVTGPICKKSWSLAAIIIQVKQNYWQNLVRLKMLVCYLQLNLLSLVGDLTLYWQLPIYLYATYQNNYLHT